MLEDVPGTRLVLGTADGRERVSWDRDRGLSIEHARRPRFLYPSAQIALADIVTVRIAIDLDRELLRVTVGLARVLDVPWRLDRPPVPC